MEAEITLPGKTISGPNVNYIKKTDIVRPYKADAKEGFKGKSFRIYTLGTKAFCVHEDSDFHADLKKGDVQSVLIEEDAEGQWSMNNYVSWTKANNTKLNQLKHDSYTVENLLAGKIIKYNPEDVAE